MSTDVKRVFNHREIYAHKLYKRDEHYMLIDLDPPTDAPHEDIWPIENWDPGATNPNNELHPRVRSEPVWGVAFVTKPYLEVVESHLVHDQERRNELADKAHKTELRRRQNNLEREKRGRGVFPARAAKEAREEAKRNLEWELDRDMRLIEERETALRRIANFLNGDVVNGQHLLLDGVAKWQTLLGDLNQDKLKRLYIDPNYPYRLANHFEDHKFYKPGQPEVYLSPQYIKRRKIHWAPTLKGKKLINETNTLPTLHGDRFERLRHRYSVGLLACHMFLKDRRSSSSSAQTIKTYYPLDFGESSANVDLYTVVECKNRRKKIVFAEVITDHNDRENWLRSLEKLRYSRFFPPSETILAAPARKPIFNALRYFESKGEIELPGTGFNTDWSLENANRRLGKAYEEDGYDCPIKAIKTLTQLRNQIDSQECSESVEDAIKSLNW